MPRPRIDTDRANDLGVCSSARIRHGQVIDVQISRPSLACDATTSNMLLDPGGLPSWVSTASCSALLGGLASRIKHNYDSGAERDSDSACNIEPRHAKWSCTFLCVLLYLTARWVRSEGITWHLPLMVCRGKGSAMPHRHRSSRHGTFVRRHKHDKPDPNDKEREE